jgi:hypothetical protein
MKKVFMVVGLAVLGLSAVACKKDYNCSCTWKAEHEDHLDDEMMNYPIGKLSKSDAEAECELKATAIAAEPDHSQVNCEIKAN